MATVEELQKEILELKTQLKTVETERDIFKAKVDYALGCFDTFEKGLNDVIEANRLAKMGIE